MSFIVCIVRKIVPLCHVCKTDLHANIFPYGAHVCLCCTISGFSTDMEMMWISSKPTRLSYDIGLLYTNLLKTRGINC